MTNKKSSSKMEFDSSTSSSESDDSDSGQASSSSSRMSRSRRLLQERAVSKKEAASGDVTRCPLKQEFSTVHTNSNSLGDKRKEVGAPPPPQPPPKQNQVNVVSSAKSGNEFSDTASESGGRTGHNNNWRRNSTPTPGQVKPDTVTSNSNAVRIPNTATSMDANLHSGIMDYFKDKKEKAAAVRSTPTPPPPAKKKEGPNLLMKTPLPTSPGQSPAPTASARTLSPIPDKSHNGIDIVKIKTSPTPTTTLPNGNTTERGTRAGVVATSGTTGTLQTRSQSDIDYDLALAVQYNEYVTKRDAGVEEVKEQEKEAQTNPRQFNRRKVPCQILETAQALPIFSVKDKLVKFIQDHQIVVVCGETGSGKSTQISQYLVEAGMASKGIIGITQPRRVAATSLAKRVSGETGETLGKKVGYAIRFDKCVSPSTLIKYMTDGTLLKECLSEPNLDSYSVIIVDEAHERTIHTDVCFALLKRATKERPDLKIIISSATLEKQKFVDYFDNAPVFDISGKAYKVNVFYDNEAGFDPVEGVVKKILKIHGQEEKGDILAFLTGQDEIEEAMEKIEKTAKSCNTGMLVLPCYANLPLEQQEKILQPAPHGKRKVVLATNVAETSLTIDGIVYVVDCGWFKQNQYNPITKISSLMKLRITRFQAIQRAGRAGRTRDGKCFRLYSQQIFDEMMDAPQPEIQRSCLESVILDLSRLGVHNPIRFDFMDAPPVNVILQGIEHLVELSAIDKNTFHLTDEGTFMSEFPLDPPLSKVLIKSVELGVVNDVLKIVAILSTQHENLFYREKEVRAYSDKCRQKFIQKEGDHLTFLHIYEKWVENGRSRDWCQENCIQARYLEEANDIGKQLYKILKKKFAKEELEKCCPQAKVKDHVRKAFLNGYFRQLAKKREVGYTYSTFSLDARADAKGPGTKQADTFLHPSSVLFRVKPAPKWIIYHEVLRTKRAFMSQAMQVEPKWVKECAPEFAEKVESYFPGSF